MSSINYEIKSKSDFLTGMYLVTRLKDSEVDLNALYTIQDDCPDFILPFNYKSINGYTEFTYKVGTMSKLQYFYGDILYADYVALWRSILSPLLECRDWFMNPCSFVLDAQHLYYDKSSKTVAYIYVPSVSACSGYEAFNKMAAEVARNMKVSDAVLENNVLRSIINDFKPNEFMKLLLEHSEQRDTATPMQAEYGMMTSSEPDNKAERESDISLQQMKDKEPRGFRLFGGKSIKDKVAKRNGFKNKMPVMLTMNSQPILDDESGATQETRALLGTAGLRCIGRFDFPQIIDIDIVEGDIFTIGRYDAGIGKKQSSFEFEANTKAVSRRHAAIEYNGENYTIIDLSSSAGTFIDDKKLPPNTPTDLKPGCRVSFGNMGADYVWEVR